MRKANQLPIRRLHLSRLLLVQETRHPSPRIIRMLGEIWNMAPTEFIIPMLVCRNASLEIEFCKAAFGAVELSRQTGEDGGVLHAALKVGAAMIMVHGKKFRRLRAAPHRWMAVPRS